MTSMPETWTIVKFTEEDSVEAVPTKWIIGNKCYWPTLPRDKIPTVIRNQDLNTCWPLHDVKIFRNAVYGDYTVARTKCRKAEETSDLNTDSEALGKRMRRPNRALLDSEESDDEGEVYTRITRPPSIHPNISESEQSQSNTPNEINIRDPQALLSSNESIKNLHVVGGDGFEINATAAPLKCCCCPEHKNGETLTHLLRQVNFLRSVVIDLAHDLRSLKLKQPDEECYESEGFLKKFPFPLTAKSDLDAVEVYLKDEEKYNSAVKELSKIGGSDAYDSVKRLFSLTLQDVLTKNFSWCGQRSKESFKNLKLSSVFIDAIMKAGGTTQKEVEDASSKFIRRANERFKNNKQ